MNTTRVAVNRPSIGRWWLPGGVTGRVTPTPDPYGSALTVALCLSISIALFICFFGREFLPTIIYNDSDTYQRILDSPSRLQQSDDTYSGIARLYANLGLSNQRVLVSVISLLLYLLLLLRVVPTRALRNASVGLCVVYTVSPVLVSVFLVGFSKDAVVLAVMLLYSVGYRGRGGRLVFLGSAIAFALTIRPYWLLIAVGYLGFRFILRRGGWAIALALALAPIVLVVAMNVLLGVPVHHYRDQVLVSVPTVADSTLNALVAGTSLPAQIANAYYILLVLIFPLPIFASEAHQVAAAVLIVAVWVNALRTLASLGPTSAGDDLDSTREHAAVCLAALVVFSLFEPDYGSYTRHLLPFLPLLLAIWHKGASARA